MCWCLGVPLPTRLAALDVGCIAVPPCRSPSPTTRRETTNPSMPFVQELELRPGSIPAGFIEAGAAATPHACVFPDEQAAMFCGWAEAALRKARCVLGSFVPFLMA